METETKPKYFREEGCHSLSIKASTKERLAISSMPLSSLFSLSLRRLPSDRLILGKTPLFDVWQPLNRTNDNLQP